MNAPVKYTALTAENNLSETVFAVVAGMDHAPADQFLLHQKEDVLRDDRFVVTIHVVLRDGAVVLSQDLFMQYSSYCNMEFYVRMYP